MKRDALEYKHQLAYAVGHFFNDLTAAGWFFYMTFYLNYIVGLDDDQTGKVILAGQFSDGITTPIVGALSDRI